MTRRNPRTGPGRGALDGRLFRHAAEHTPLYCICDDPETETCGPIFTSARQCRHCGRPLLEDIDPGGNLPA